MHIIISQLLRSAKKRQDLAFRLRALIFKDRQEGLNKTYRGGRYNAYVKRNFTEYSEWEDEQHNMQRSFDAWSLGLCPEAVKDVPNMHICLS